MFSVMPRAGSVVRGRRVLVTDAVILWARRARHTMRRLLLLWVHGLVDGEISRKGAKGSLRNKSVK